ncbi:MAG: tRNA (adenosine(37)-N6)-dimethylallyltransferase MiaA [Steroidobacteraceae bacterium]
MSRDIPAILLMGPTGAGKTDLAIRLSEAWPLGIVSVDSAMVYRGLDIGSAKPDASTLARVRHRLVDIADPAERYSVGRFLQDVGAAMAEVRAEGRFPLLVGGTMLYFRALQSGLAAMPEADPVIRARIDARAAELGWPALHAELGRLDPTAAAGIRPLDRQRIQRALEVIELTGQPLSAHWGEDFHGSTRSRDLKFILAPSDRAWLGAHLERRFDAMLAAGLLAEVERLYARGDLSAELPAIRAVGYRQLWEVLTGSMPLSEARDRAVIASRQLARRQLTWCRREPESVWVDALEEGSFDQISRKVGAWLMLHGNR